MGSTSIATKAEFSLESTLPRLIRNSSGIGDQLGNGASIGKDNYLEKINNISIFYTNARSLRNKKNELFSYIINEGPDIICITESWVNESQFGDLKDEYIIEKYKLFLHQRTNTIGGGIILYINEEFNSLEIEDIKINDSLVESIWIDIKINSKEILRLGIVYRPPNQGELVDSQLVEELKVGCQNRNFKTLILGDFNLPDINWNLNVGMENNSRKFVECFNDCFLSQVVDMPTRGNKILDLALVNDINIISSVNVGETLANSDHNIIRLILNLEIHKINNTRMVPDLNKGDFIKFRELLRNISWDLEFEGKNTNEMWTRFIDVIRDFQNRCVPLKAIRNNRKKKPLWWQANIKKGLSIKKRAHRKFKMTGSIEDLETYREARNNVAKDIRKNKRLAEIELARNSNKDPKKFFQYYKHNSKRQDKVGPIEHNGHIVEGELETVQVLNQYFSSVFTDEKTDSFDFSLPKANVNESSKFELSIDRNRIRELILKSCINKSAGPDQISARILKEGEDSIVEALCLIFSKSLSCNEIPEDWKIANVTPIFKKGSRKLTSNYRPISLTSLVVKLLERLIKDRIHDYLDEKSIIRDSQHLFRSGRSCLTNLLSFLEYVTDQVDSGEDIDVVYLDFSKAFDKVPHKRLIYKLKEYKINNSIVDWIENWLNDRKQRVVLNGIHSDWLRVKSGVPQGSVLGPLLFLIYINDIDIGLGSNIYKGADDTKLAGRVGTTEGAYKLQRDIDKLIGWADKWQMEFNVDKCKVVHVGNKNEGFVYSMGGKWLDAVDRERDLGVIISQDLKAHKQSIEARNKANRMLGIINRNVSYKSKEVITKLYNSYVRPHLEYCIQAWRPYHRYDINMLESVQRRATKLIPSLKNHSYESRLKELGMYSFERRCKRGDMIEVFKMFSGMNDLNVGEFFDIDVDDRTRGHSRKIRKKTCRLDLRKNFFSCRVVDLWNSLPTEVVNSSSLNIFKSRLDKFMDSG